MGFPDSLRQQLQTVSSRVCTINLIALYIAVRLEISYVCCKILNGHSKCGLEAWVVQWLSVILRGCRVIPAVSYDCDFVVLSALFSALLLWASFSAFERFFPPVSVGVLHLRALLPALFCERLLPSAYVRRLVFPTMTYASSPTRSFCDFSTGPTSFPALPLVTSRPPPVGVLFRF